MITLSVLPVLLPSASAASRFRPVDSGWDSRGRFRVSRLIGFFLARPAPFKPEKRRPRSVDKEEMGSLPSSLVALRPRSPESPRARLARTTVPDAPWVEATRRSPPKLARIRRRRPRRPRRVRLRPDAARASRTGRENAATTSAMAAAARVASRAPRRAREASTRARRPRAPRKALPPSSLTRPRRVLGVPLPARRQPARVERQGDEHPVQGVHGHVPVHDDGGEAQGALRQQAPQERLLPVLPAPQGVTRAGACEACDERERVEERRGRKRGPLASAPTPSETLRGRLEKRRWYRRFVTITKTKQS